jgi:hypothetical protein
MAVLRELTNLNDITRVLHEMLARERCVNAELEGLTAKRGTLETGLVTLRSSTAEVHLKVHRVLPATSDSSVPRIKQHAVHAQQADVWRTDAGGCACGCGVIGS